MYGKRVLLEEPPTGSGSMAPHLERFFIFEGGMTTLVTSQYWHGSNLPVLQPVYVEAGWFEDWIKAHPTGKYRFASS